MKILITGGTVFVSRYAARWFAQRGYDVFVLNRGTRPQEEGVSLIRADRHKLGGALKQHSFDAVLDICGYNPQDINSLLDGLGEFGEYVFVSSSAVYPETLPQPFREDMPTGENTVWGKYGTDKLAAERALLERCPQAYILRPPYLYGEMQNLYREPFVFECAEKGRAFFVPKDGEMKLQFFYVGDLCRLMERLITERPSQHILNVGNREGCSINEFVRLCYEAAGAKLRTVNVYDHPNQRDYFSFYDYQYMLDVGRMSEILPELTPLSEGIKRSYEWYKAHREEVPRRGYIDFIDGTLK